MKRWSRATSSQTKNSCVACVLGSTSPQLSLAFYLRRESGSLVLIALHFPDGEARESGLFSVRKLLLEVKNDHQSHYNLSIYNNPGTWNVCSKSQGNILTTIIHLLMALNKNSGSLKPLSDNDCGIATLSRLAYFN